MAKRYRTNSTPCQFVRCRYLRHRTDTHLHAQIYIYRFTNTNMPEIERCRENDEKITSVVFNGRILIIEIRTRTRSKISVKEFLEKSFYK